jgi:allophanate hydrolase subunit 1
MGPDIEFLGDAALLLRFGARIDPAVNDAVLAAAERLREAALPGILDLVPAYASLTVCYDPGVWWAGELRAHIAALAFPAAARPPAGAEVPIPVCYEPEFAPDLDAVCAHTGLDAAEVVRRHQAVAYRAFPISANSIRRCTCRGARPRGGRYRRVRWRSAAGRPASTPWSRREAGS